MSDPLRIFIHGKPSSQGSKTAFRRRDGSMGVRPATKTERPWRQLVVDMMSEEWEGPPMEGAVELTMTFAFVRPKSGEGKKRPSPSVKPDAEKLQRAVQDALKLAGVIRDDGQIVAWQGLKEYRDVPGVEIEVRKLQGGRQ